MNISTELILGGTFPMARSLYSALQQRFHAAPDKTALHIPATDTTTARALSYAELDLMSGKMAQALSAHGVMQGDRVAVQAEKSATSLYLYLGCLRMGAVFLPMNTAYRTDEVDYLVGNAEPSAIICDPSALDALTGIAEKHGVKALLTLDAHGNGTLATAAQTQDGQHILPDIQPDDLAAMLYTSGTTGKPKGAMLTHNNLLSNAESLIESWQFTSNDVLLHALPIFHAHGLFVGCHTTLLAGGSMIWLPGFKQDVVLSHLPKATVMMGVPTFYTRLLSDPRLTATLTQNMRLFISGSAPLLAETHKAWTARTNHAILERYGMTETGMNTSNPYDGTRIPGSVGFPLPGVEARICDDADVVLGDNETGNLQVRGANVMKGYWRMPEKTAAEFTADGWFRTGDIAKRDSQGYYYIVGRAKDMIISGGYNVYPKEIEAVMDKMDGVLESALVGIPHPDFGEVGVAVIIPKAGHPAPDADAVINHIKSTMANYKVPKLVVHKDSLPRNTMGKVQKNLLRDEFSDTFTTA